MDMRYVLTGFLLISSFVAHAQYNELSVQFESGLFSFRGSQVVQESFFNIGRETPGVSTKSYTNDPWSKRSSFSWGVSMQGQHVTKSNFIVGLQLGYEDLATTTQIIGGYDLGQFIAFQEGKAIFRYQYVNLHPFIGQRFGNRQMSLDLTVGIDGAVGLYSWEKGKGTSSTNLLYVTSYKHSIPGLDLRPRLGITAYYHSVGLSLSYAYGLTNYSDNLVGVSSSNANTQFWRVGGIYRLAK